jgi:hypothetical protein
MTGLLQDVRYALRQLRKNPGFTAVAILTLALGIGANTAIFTLLHASLWSPLPVSDPKEIFHVMRASSEGDFAGEFSYSYPLFQQFSKIASPLGEVFATEVVGPRKFGVNGFSDQRVAGEAVAGNFFFRSKSGANRRTSARTARRHCAWRESRRSLELCVLEAPLPIRRIGWSTPSHPSPARNKWWTMSGATLTESLFPIIG